MAAYEELRRGATSSTSERRFGLVVVMRQGVAAWVARRSSGAPPRTEAAEPDRRIGSVVVSDEVASGMVRVLVQMALADRKEMTI